MDVIPLPPEPENLPPKPSPPKPKEPKLEVFSPSGDAVPFGAAFTSADTNFKEVPAQPRLLEDPLWECEKCLMRYRAKVGAAVCPVCSVPKPIAGEKPKERPHVVEFKGVTKTYGGKTPYTAIKDVTFFVADIPDKGEMIAVLGPSGCGKSTVLKLIAGLEPQHPATTGEVLVLGKPVLGPGADRGMVFQEYSAFDNRTVLDNIAFGLECRGMKTKERHEQAKHWIEKVGLNSAKDAGKFPHQLSGGMRQRVAIARSLILKPRILLMDEPFGALDPMTRFRMQDLLINLWKDTETTVFFVTHSIPEAVFVGDRIYLFSNAPGTIIEEVHAHRPSQPAVDAHQEADFQEKVKNIRIKIAKMEEERGII
jgi:NitT/TauT family transport system ATP-binding protein